MEWNKPKELAGGEDGRSFLPPLLHNGDCLTPQRKVGVFLCRKSDMFERAPGNCVTLEESLLLLLQSTINPNFPTITIFFR